VVVMTWLIERRLTDTSARLRNARTELSILDEQLAVITEEAEDSRIRAMVAETPQALTEYSEGQRHVRGMGNARADLVKKIAELTQQQDDLLDRMSKKSAQ
jgi:hypothetical protein